jgi:threonine synthase
MYIKHLECVRCKRRYGREKLRYRCDCGSSLDIIYDYRTLKKRMGWALLRGRPFNHWRYKEFYPFVHNDSRVTLSEGGTPLTRSKTIPNLYFKLESCNPTGSFKDRGTSIEISHALEERAKRVVCASTGNMGASISAYCARAGLKCEIFLPVDTSPGKVKQISVYGAKITRIKGDYTKAAKIAFQRFKQKHDFLVGDYSYRGEGEKSIAFELIDQLGKIDYLLCPIGNGTLLSSIWKGFKEFKNVGLVNRLPKLIGVQASGCSPVAKAFLEKKRIKPVIPKTKASAIACGDPLDGEKAVKALKESKGQVLIVSDNDLIKTRKKLSTTEGIDAELAGVAAYCAATKLNLSDNKIKVCVTTGHGLKDIDLMK